MELGVSGDVKHVLELLKMFVTTFCYFNALNTESKLEYRNQTLSPLIVTSPNLLTRFNLMKKCSIEQGVVGGIQIQYIIIYDLIFDFIRIRLPIC